MEVSSERTLEPVQLVLRLVGRDDLSGFYRQHPIEAGRAASAAAQAYIRHHPVSVRPTLGVNTLRAMEIEPFFIRVGKLMLGRPRFASSEDVLEQDRSLLETLSLESIERPLPQDWEAFFSGLESSQKETLTDFFMALDAAFSARALDDGPGEGSSGEADRPDEIPERLRPFVRTEDPPGEMLGVQEAAARLEVSRPTIYEWMRSGTLVGWPRGTVQGRVIPAEQILGPGSVAPGLEQLSATIGAPQLVWDFLSRPWPFADREQRPIERLHSGVPALVQSVLDAAPAYGNSST